MMDQMSFSPFRFLDLPIEIRRKIYKCFTDRLWDHMNDPKIRFSTVERAWSWKPGRQNAMYGVEVSSDRPDFTACYDELAGRRDLMRPTCTSDEASETSSSSSDVSMEEAPAPAPVPIPQVSVVVNRKFTTRDLGKPGGEALIDPDERCPLHPLPKHYHCHHSPPADFASAIRLSQVSRQVTRELGECLWENAAVEFDDAGTLIMFARERPAALPFIRGIALSIDSGRNAPSFCTDTNELAAALSLVSEHLDLRFFHVTLRALAWDKNAIFESSVQDLLGTEVVDWAPSFRAVRTDTFYMQVLELYPEDDVVPWPPPPRPLPDSVHAAVLHLWKPDCVREKGASEGANYLRLRGHFG